MPFLLLCCLSLLAATAIRRQQQRARVSHVADGVVGTWRRIFLLCGAKRPTPRPRNRMAGAHKLVRVPRDEASAELAEANVAEEEEEAAVGAVVVVGSAEAEGERQPRDLAVESAERGSGKRFVVDVELD